MGLKAPEIRSLPPAKSQGGSRESRQSDGSSSWRRNAQGTSSAALQGALGLQRRAGVLAGRESLIMGGLEARQFSPGQPSPSPRSAPHPAAFSQAPHPRRADRKPPSLPRVTQRPWLAQVCPWRGVGRGRRRAGQVVSRTGENSSPRRPPSSSSSSSRTPEAAGGPSSCPEAAVGARALLPGPAPRRAGAQLATVPRGRSPPSPGLSAARALPPVHGSRGALSSRGRAGRRLPSPGVCAAL